MDSEEYQSLLDASFPDPTPRSTSVQVNTSIREPAGDGPVQLPAEMAAYTLGDQALNDEQAQTSLAGLSPALSNEEERVGEQAHEPGDEKEGGRTRESLIGLSVAEKKERQRVQNRAAAERSRKRKHDEQ